MKPKRIHLLSFSATGTTAKIVASVGAGAAEKACPATTADAETTAPYQAAAERFSEHDLLHPLPESITLRGDEAAIIGVPVFSGRVPETARAELAKVRGDGTPAILVCVYGNRAYDDALVELEAIVRANGFIPVAAAAFVAQHSIFPEVGHGRPDASDLQQAREFGRRSMELTEVAAEGLLHLKGNTPYREYKRIPLTPRTDRHCNGCGACAKGCPVQAIDPADPRRTDKQRCTPCAHGIAVCPQHARHFGGLLYRFARHKFVKAYAERLEPEVFYRK